MRKLRPLVEPGQYPIIEMTIAEVAEAKRLGQLRIHDNGTLTLHRSPPQEIRVTNSVDRRP